MVERAPAAAAPPPLAGTGEAAAVDAAGVAGEPSSFGMSLGRPRLRLISPTGAGNDDDMTHYARIRWFVRAATDAGRKRHRERERERCDRSHRAQVIESKPRVG